MMWLSLGRATLFSLSCFHLFWFYIFQRKNWSHLYFHFIKNIFNDIKNILKSSHIYFSKIWKNMIVVNFPDKFNYCPNSYSFCHESLQSLPQQRVYFLPLVFGLDQLICHNSFLPLVQLHVPVLSHMHVSHSLSIEVSFSLWGIFSSSSRMKRTVQKFTVYLPFTVAQSH
jgi:hypothetical protein